MLSGLLSRHPLLGQALCLPWELAINQALAHDPATLASLRPLSGRLLCICVPAVTRLYVRLLPEGISISLGSHDEQADAVDLQLTGSMADFAALASARDKSTALMGSQILLDGDTDLASRLSRIAAQIDIDWEAMLEPLTGGLLAHQLGESMRSLLQWGRESGRTLRTATRDYVQDEVELVTPAPLLEQFAAGVDELRLATDRLEARVQQLELSQAGYNTPDNSPDGGE